MKERMLGIKDTAAAIGISEWELRTGCWSGKYPHMRIGGKKGKIIFDIHLLENHIRNLMLQSVEDDESIKPQIRRVE